VKPKFLRKGVLNLENGGKLFLSSESWLLEHAWALEVNTSNTVDIWQAKFRFFRRHAKGRSSNFEAAARKHKKELMSEYDALDIKS
jgi:hypothetical protein